MNIKLYVATITQVDDNESFIDHQAVSTEKHAAEQAVLDAFNDAWRQRYKDSETEGEWEDKTSKDFPFEFGMGTWNFDMNEHEVEV